MVRIVFSPEILTVGSQGCAREPKHVISPANETDSNGDVPAFDGELSKARELCKERGWRWDDEGRIMGPKN